MRDMVEGYKKMMKIMNKEPLSKYTSKHVQRPIDINDDEDIEKLFEKRQTPSIILLGLVRWD
jgi:hypothetical protein